MFEGGSRGLVQAAARAEIGVSDRWTANLALPFQGGLGAGWSPWDAIVTGGWRAVDRDRLAVTLRPGVSLPLGPNGPTAAFVPGTTGSVDPWLGASVVGGEAWLGIGQVRARAPLYAGRDGVHQGAWVRVDAGPGRRLGPVVLTTTASGVHRLADDTGAGGFTELAAEASVTWNLAARWATSATARVPIWTTATAAGAGALSVTHVFGGAGGH